MYTNRDSLGAVEFKRVAGMTGVILINQVSNPKELGIGSNVAKKIVTLFSLDNGASWEQIKPPSHDSNGDVYCADKSETCKLNLHLKSVAYHSNSNAAGVVIAVGSVGKHLLPYNDCDTFLSRDSGVTWSEMRKNAHIWAIGDHGGVIVLTNNEESTDAILYIFPFLLFLATLGTLEYLGHRINSHLDQ